MAQWKTWFLVSDDQNRIFQGDSLSLLLLVIALILLSTILNKSGNSCQTSKTSVRLSHLFYVNDLKLYGKTPSEIETLLNTVHSADIAMKWTNMPPYQQRAKIMKIEGIKMLYEKKT